VIHETEMRAAPGGPVLGRLPTRTEFGSQEFLWVVRSQPGWLGVVSPIAGNGRLGWIPASAATLSTNAWELRVSLSAHSLTVSENHRMLARYAVAVGRPTAPTPTGRFAVTDRLATGDPAGPYGCCILALSARSPHPIEGWSGGNRVAIHSTPDASAIGHSVTHGCVRVDLTNGRWLLDHIPLGTPALISP
jgi:lipoprotein-anchoring transpeptidase ErfK/SrfK